MTHSIEPLTQLGRRKLLQLSAAAAWLPVSGCGFYEAESGSAFEPWHFPNAQLSPEVVAVQAALLAASPHNTQPWSFHVTPSRIDVRVVAGRNLGAMDSLRREQHIGLGCALENLVLSARSNGRDCDVTLCPDPRDPGWVASLRLRAAPPVQEPLFAAIPRRHCNRGEYAATPLPPSAAATLDRIVTQQGVRLRLLTAPDDRAHFRTQTIAATEAIVDDPAMSDDGHAWYRHSHAEIERYRDGLTLDCAGLGTLTRVFGKLLPRPDAKSAGAYWLDATRTRHTTGAAYGVIYASAQNTRIEQLRVGRAFQRLQLWATVQGLAVQPLNQLVERQDREESSGAAPRFGPYLATLTGGREWRTQMLFRIGAPRAASFRSPRRPLAWTASLNLG